MAGGRGDRRNRVSRQICRRALPGLNRARPPRHIAAPPARAAAAVGRRCYRDCDRGPEPALAGGKRLAVRRPHRHTGGGKKHSALAVLVSRPGDPGARASLRPGLARGPRGLRLLAAFCAVPVGRRELGLPDRRGRDRSREAILPRARLPAPDRRRRNRARSLASASRQARVRRVRAGRRGGDGALRHAAAADRKFHRPSTMDRRHAQHRRAAEARRAAGLLRRHVRLAGTRRDRRQGVSGPAAGGPRSVEDGSREGRPRRRSRRNG